MNTRKERGITLIALIVTIIVLLILAGISIGAITGDNEIIKQAQNAKDDTQYAEWEEKIDIAIIDAESKNKDTTMDDVIEELIYNEIISDEDQVDKETGTITTNEPSYVFDDKLKDYIEVFTVDKLKAGEYVNYVDATGETRKCIVLWDESSGYGTQIITQNTVGDVTLGSNGTEYVLENSSSSGDIDEAVEDYNNAITMLNDEAMKYLNSTYASDARCVGSVPNDKNSETKIFMSNTEYLGRDLKDADENYLFDNNQMNKLGIEYTETGSDYDYWLASRTNAVNARSKWSKNAYWT